MQLLSWICKSLSYMNEGHTRQYIHVNSDPSLNRKKKGMCNEEIRGQNVQR